MVLRLPMVGFYLFVHEFLLFCLFVVVLSCLFSYVKRRLPWKEKDYSSEKRSEVGQPTEHRNSVNSILTWIHHLGSQNGSWCSQPAQSSQRHLLLCLLELYLSQTQHLLFSFLFQATSPFLRIDIMCCTRLCIFFFQNSAETWIILNAY